MDGVVLSRDGCNILNFGPNTYRLEPINYDVILMFYILGQRLHCIWTWWFFLYIGHKPIIDDICICLFVMGVDREVHDWQDLLCWVRSSRTLDWFINCVEHKLWSIRSLAIVSLGVLYKYILEFSIEQKLWNCTMFVTPCYKRWVWALVSARGYWKD